MKRVTSYIVAVFALASLLGTTNALAAKPMYKNVCGTILSTSHEEPGPNGGKVFKIEVRTDDGDVQTLTICNQGCYNALVAAAGGNPYNVKACPVCAKCYENCKTKIESHFDTKACFMIAQDKDTKYVQGQPCCDDFGDNCSDATKSDTVCYKCGAMPEVFGDNLEHMVKCFTPIE